MINRLTSLKFQKYAITLALLMLISACGTLPVPFEGESLSSQWSKEELYVGISAIVNSYHGCSSIDRIVISILQKPTGERGSQTFAEGWEVYGCNQSFYYEVIFHPKGSGTYNYSINPKP